MLDGREVRQDGTQAFISYQKAAVQECDTAHALVEMTKDDKTSSIGVAPLPLSRATKEHKDIADKQIEKSSESEPSSPFGPKESIADILKEIDKQPMGGGIKLFSFGPKIISCESEEDFEMKFPERYRKLEEPFLYRGDTRTPDIIFKEGFRRRIGKESGITSEHESINLIACSKKLHYAVGFADCPANTQGKTPPIEKNEYSWVYLIYVEKGLDLTTGSFYTGGNINKATSVDEVALTDVPPERIIAAFQIKTTANIIDAYLQRPYQKIEIDRIEVTEFTFNNKCTVQPSLYSKVLEEFKEPYVKRYYQFPPQYKIDTQCTVDIKSAGMANSKSGIFKALSVVENSSAKTPAAFFGGSAAQPKLAAQKKEQKAPAKAVVFSG